MNNRRPGFPSVLVAASVALSFPAQSALSQVHEAAPRPAQAAELPDLSGIQEDLEKLRGLKFIGDVPAEVQSVEDWTKHLESELEKYFPADRRKGMQAGLARLGMMDANTDVGEELLGALQSQAGAYYDPSTAKFYYLMADLPKEMLETVAAHELVHALQDQHFDLIEVMLELEAEMTGDVRNDDRLLAVRGLIEGEATYVHTLWQLKAMNMDVTNNEQMQKMQFQAMANMDIEQLVNMTQQQQMQMFEGEDNPLAGAMEQMGNIPPYILHPLYAAYMKGAYYTMCLKHDGGWEAVDAAYESLPMSSEQMMHPEKYLGNRDNPTPISLPRLDALAERGWKPVDSATHGEFFLGLMMSNQDQPRVEVNDAVAGWDGDIYRAYQGPDDRTLIVLATTWDDEDEAMEFFRYYKQMLPDKYEAFSVDEGGDQQVAFTCGPELGHGRLALRGREVFVVEGGSAAECKGVIEQLGAMEVKHVD